MVTEPEAVAAAIAAATSSANGKPVMANFLATEGLPGPLRAVGVPSFRFPEAAARALGKVTEYAQWRRQPQGVVPQLPRIDRGAARAVVDQLLSDQPTGAWLDASKAAALLGAYGIGVVPSVPVRSATEAGDAAVKLRFPVALKVGSPDVVHKTDVGGVRLDLGSREAVEAAYVKMEADVGPAMGGALVQPMVEPGVETIVGLVQDPAFGPLVLFGMGGTVVELLGDRAFRILPLTDVDAAEMVRSPRASALLFGHRGRPPGDVAAVEDLLLRVGILADQVPEVRELDLNPVVVATRGVAVVDAKVYVAPVQARPELAVRRLR